jgi:hypothetical protein
MAAGARAWLVADEHSVCDELVPASYLALLGHDGAKHFPAVSRPLEPFRQPTLSR